MKLLASLIPLLDVVPTLIRVCILWILVVAVFYYFKGNKSRSLALSALILLFNVQFETLERFLPSLIAYGALGVAGAGTEALFLHLFGGIWVYGNPKILKVPLWLFPLWSLCAMAIVNVYPVIVKVIMHGQDIAQNILDMAINHKKN